MCHVEAFLFLPLVHQVLIGLDVGCKEAFQVGYTIDSAALAILKEKKQVLDILWTIVEWSSRKEYHLLLHALQQAWMGTRGFTDNLQLVVAVRLITSETVGLIHNHQIKFLFVEVLLTPFEYLGEATIGHKLGLLLNAEKGEGVTPVALHGWWIDHENACTAPVGLNKAFGYHGGDYGLS